MAERVIDQWAGLNHKSIMTGTPGNAPAAPTWVPRTEWRRLNAYRVLAAYRLNAAREYAAADSDDDRMARREYGDADLLIRQTAAAMIGRGASLAVVGSERPPEEPPADASAEQFAEFHRVTAGYSAIVARQAEITKWADDEQWSLRINRAEEDAVGLGDTIYWLTYSTKKARVRLRTLDPGFYFPVYPADGDADDYPRKVHLAWEYEEEDPGMGFGRGQPRKWLRRITYELVELESPRTLNYAEEPTTDTCLMTDARWNLSNLRGDSSDLDISMAEVTLNEEGMPILALDLGIDFIPVVHLPNMGGSPWGSSLILPICQILDDIQIADTDGSDAASVAGGPPIAVAGVSREETLEHYGPRTTWFLPNGGGATVLDTSKGLASLHDHIDRLFKRASTNSRIPEEVLGRVGANEVPSGLALSLSFGPFEVMIEQARLVRKFKYGLLLKMIQRLHIAQGTWKAPVSPAEVVFGSALPSDLSTLSDVLGKMVGDKSLLSRASAIRILANAGLPIPEVAVEVDRIEAEDFAGANMLYRATRSPALASEYLRRLLPEDVLMEQLGKLLQREVHLDEIRDLFDVQKQAENAATVAAADKSAQGLANEREGSNVPKNTSQGDGNRGRQTPDAKKAEVENARRADRGTKRGI